jgi:hypothetical protein
MNPINCQEINKSVTFLLWVSVKLVIIQCMYKELDTPVRWICWLHDETLVIWIQNNVGLL